MLDLSSLKTAILTMSRGIEKTLDERMMSGLIPMMETSPGKCIKSQSSLWIKRKVFLKSWRHAMIDVPFEQMRLLNDLIAQQLPDAEIWAFGSRMEGTAKPYSDLDLVIVLDEIMPFDRYLRVRNAFDESELSFRVDVMDFHRLNPSLQKRIQERHVVLCKPSCMHIPIHRQQGRTR